MEGSIQSSMNKSLCSNEGADSGEESGWTMYFEDFMASEKRRGSGCSSIDGGGSSIVSDAASCVAWNSAVRIVASESCKKLSFKRRKARGGLDDDDPLEDTASSPVNSPKVSGLDHLDMNPRKKDDNRDISQQKDVENWAEVRRPEIAELGYNERTNDCTELKKRGLCLVPMSMLVDYIG